MYGTFNYEFKTNPESAQYGLEINLKQSLQARRVDSVAGGSFIFGR